MKTKRGLFFLAVVLTFAKAIPSGDDIKKNLLDDGKGIDKFESLCQQFGYPVEKHFVTTEDGYNLRMHRIPHGVTNITKNKVFFVQHGLLESSADFVFTGPDHGLGFTLADAGYDVWFGNARGNYYSRNHTKYNPDGFFDGGKFWDFSWHEIGTIDLPTMIDYVLQKTGKNKLLYTGHSQGTTAFFVMMSERPEFNNKIEAQFSMSPVVYMKHVPNPVLQLISNFNPVLDLAPLFGYDEFLPTRNFMSKIERLVCGDKLVVLCENVLYLMAGFDPAEANDTVIQESLYYVPSGASTRQALHYAQGVSSGKFRQYDYGLTNIAHYGQLTPPKYNLVRTRIPVHLFYSQNDWMSSEKDVNKLCDEISHCAEMILVDNGKFNHLDYIFGIHAKVYVYDKIVEIAEKEYGN